MAHFFGIHAVHFIALFAWLLQRWSRHPGRLAAAAATTPVLWLFCAVYGVFSTWTFVQAVRGLPFFA